MYYLLGVLSAVRVYCLSLGNLYDGYFKHVSSFRSVKVDFLSKNYLADQRPGVRLMWRRYKVMSSGRVEFQLSVESDGAASVAHETTALVIGG